MKNAVKSKIIKSLSHILGGQKSFNQLKSHLSLLAAKHKVNNQNGSLQINLTAKVVRQAQSLLTDNLATYALSICVNDLLRLSDFSNLPAFDGTARVWDIACQIVRHSSCLLSEAEVSELKQHVKNSFNMSSTEVSALDCALTLAYAEYICICCLLEDEKSQQVLAYFTKFADKLLSKQLLSGSPKYTSGNYTLCGNQIMSVDSGISADCKLQIKHKKRILIDSVCKHVVQKDNALLVGEGAKSGLKTKIKIDNAVKAVCEIDDNYKNSRSLTALYEIKFTQTGKVSAKEFSFINLDDAIVVTDNCDFYFCFSCDKKFDAKFFSDESCALLIIEMPISKNSNKWCFNNKIAGTMQDVLCEVSSGRRIGYYLYSCIELEKAYYTVTEKPYSETNLIKNAPYILPSRCVSGKDLSKSFVSTRLLSNNTTVTFCNGQLTLPHGELLWLRYADRITAINTDVSTVEEIDNKLIYTFKDNLIESQLIISDGDEKTWQLSVTSKSQFVKDVCAQLCLELTSFRKIAISECKTRVLLDGCELVCSGQCKIQLGLGQKLYLTFEDVKNKQAKFVLKCSHVFTSNIKGILPQINHDVLLDLQNHNILPNCLNTAALCYTHPDFVDYYIDKLSKDNQVAYADKFCSEVSCNLSSYTLPFLLLTHSLSSCRELSAEQHQIINRACLAPHCGTFELIMRCVVVSKYISLSQNKLFLVALAKKLQEEIRTLKDYKWRAFAILVGALDEKPQTIDELNELWYAIGNQMPKNWYYAALIEIMYGLTLGGGTFTLKNRLVEMLPPMEFFLANKEIVLRAKNSGMAQYRLNGCSFLGNVSLSALKTQNEIVVEY